MDSPLTHIITPETVNSLHELFLERAKRSPHNPAYTYWENTHEKWQTYSWQDMAFQVTRWREALLRENLSTSDRVALMLPNGPLWICFEQAALSLGIVVVPLYANDRPDNIAYILEDTETKILLCPGLAYWDHLAPVVDRLSSIQRIITVDDCQAEHEERIICLTDWLKDDVEHLEYVPETHQTATIVYTSGTTGPPKGVMLSHKNILSNAYAGLKTTTIFESDNFLSFLPLSHMLERTVGYVLPMMAGSSVTFARSILELAEDLLQIKPTVLVAVPRIFERIHNGIREKVAAKPAFAQMLFEKTVDIGWQSFENKQGRQNWQISQLFKPLLDMLVARKIRAKFGGHLRVVITGGAPLSKEIAKVFLGLGFPLLQGYGLTETSPIVSVNRQNNNRPEGVGIPLPDVEIKVSDQDELLVRGDCVMLGYWKNQKATDEILDPQGWLYTGDKVSLDDGHLQITGRIKEIIVLSNSEKIAPADMEMAIAMDPLFEFNMVVGEGRPYLTLLAVVHKNHKKLLLDELNLEDSEDILRDPKVLDAALQRIEKQLANFPGFAWIKQVTLLDEPWTVESGLLTPTLKLKRKTILEHLHEDVEKMYIE